MILAPKCTARRGASSGTPPGRWGRKRMKIDKNMRGGEVEIRVAPVLREEERIRGDFQQDSRDIGGGTLRTMPPEEGRAEGAPKTTQEACHQKKVKKGTLHPGTARWLGPGFRNPAGTLSTFSTAAGLRTRDSHKTHARTLRAQGIWDAWAPRLAGKQT